jgi:hypothetical protein
MVNTAIKTHPTSNASAILPLVLVFLCGVSVGALAMSFREHKMRHDTAVLSSKDPRILNNITVERWKTELNLTDTQAKEIEEILDDFSKYYDNVLGDGNTRIMKILDPKQQAKFKQMLSERH